MASIHIWSFQLPGGVLSPEGARIDNVQDQGGVPMELRLAGGDRLVGIDLEDREVIAEQHGLVGTRITVSADDEPYELLIGGVTPDDELWISDRLAVEAYELYYRPLTRDDWTPLCPPDHRDARAGNALAFNGDVYDSGYRSITVGPEAEGRLNIACSDSAIYKMHKAGHTTAAQRRTGITTTVAQRRAMLNAWTSNI